ncbi:hypothetical protein NEMBOFW57_008172 [Staphylotrichum longicolle]|uniref:VWFA domain-containing protein n=1 Tax=Staphylotrichum longicolle TaxID=669026 RepID=A0AAD4EV14_9PEZI|nr:hypothetical protein NEMBOFW57_008172 [Staphylotrichum longicolle]
MTSTATIDCLLDVSGSMREALETGRPGEGAIERLQAVLRAALHLAQTEKERDPHARMFVAAFGLNEQTKCPPVVDLCSVVATLLETLLIGLANEHNLEHINKYIRTKLSDDEARIVYAHMRRHPERVTEFVNAIPTAEEMENRRWQGQKGGLLVGASAGSPLGPFGVLAGAALGAALANAGVSVAEDIGVENSEALKLARRIWDEWWLDSAKLVPRSVAEVVDLLQRLQEYPSTPHDRSRNGDNNDTGTLLDMLRRYMYGWTPMKQALEKSLAVFVQTPAAHERVLVLISDGYSTDGDPLPVARELQQKGVTIAAVYLTANRQFWNRRLHDRPAAGWNEGQQKLFSMTAKVAGATHPMPVFASTGWEVPSSGECALYITACTSDLLEEFCSALLSARFKSADVLLDILGRVELDSFINDEHVPPYRVSPDGGGHAVVLVKCDPRSLTFLNSWGRQWGDNGSFSVEDHTVLQLDRSSGPSPVNFYDVYWLESELSTQERQAYSDKADDAFRARAEQPETE